MLMLLKCSQKNLQLRDTKENWFVQCSQSILIDLEANHCHAESIATCDRKLPGSVQNELILNFHRLIYDILDGNVLSDDHISAGSQLLHAQFSNFQGLSSPLLGQSLSFPNFDEILGYAGHSYLQILHTGSHHWVEVEIVKYTYMIASIK